VAVTAEESFAINAVAVVQVDVVFVAVVVLWEEKTRMKVG